MRRSSRSASSPRRSGLLAVACLALAACGSESDGTGSTGPDPVTPPVTVTVRDVVAPTVLAVVPANGATNVDSAATVVVTFSEPMDRATLTAAAIRLSAGATPIATNVSIAADDRSVTLTPTSALAINTLFTVTVDADQGGILT